MGRTSYLCAFIILELEFSIAPRICFLCAKHPPRDHVREARRLCILLETPGSSRRLQLSLLPHVHPYIFLAKLLVIASCSGFCSEFRELFHVNVVVASELVLYMVIMSPLNYSFFSSKQIEDFLLFFVTQYTHFWYRSCCVSLDHYR